jgi:hypothetical protein
MRLRSLRLPIIAATLAVAVPCGAAIAETASASVHHHTVLFNLTDSPQVKPARFFFQANSGPYLKSLKWTHWGKATATARGTYILDCSHGGSACAPGDPSQHHPARYTVSGLKKCPKLGAHFQYYTHGRVRVDQGHGYFKTTRFDPDSGTCG